MQDRPDEDGVRATGGGASAYVALGCIVLGALMISYAILRSLILGFITQSV